MPKLPQIKRSRRKDNPEARMSIGDHLRELRNRLFISALGVLVMSVVGYVLYEQAFSLITRPIDAANARGANLTLNFDTILASFDMRLQVSIWLVHPQWGGEQDAEPDGNLESHIEGGQDRVEVQSEVGAAGIGGIDRPGDEGESLLVQHIAHNRHHQDA